jgi:hypothetical protein
MSTTIFLDSFETAPSSYRLNKYVHEMKHDYPNLSDEEIGKKARQKIAKEISIDIRRQALFYGKIVITDSTTYNNFLFGEMADDDFDALCENCKDIIIAHHRPGLIVEGLYGKDYNMRDYWSKELQSRANAIGKRIKAEREETGKPVLREDTGAALIEKFIEMDPDIKYVSDFPAFEHFMKRCDRFVSALGEENFVLYGDGKAPDHFIVNKKEKILLPKLGHFAAIFGDTNPAITGLRELIHKPGYPNFSAIETQCNALITQTESFSDPKIDKEYLKNEIQNFYLQDFHEGVAVYGMASQHHCTSVEQAYGISSYTLTGNYLCSRVPQTIKDYIRSASWREFFDLFNSEEIRKKRMNLYTALEVANQPMTDIQIAALSHAIKGMTGGDIYRPEDFSATGVSSFKPVIDGSKTHINGEDDEYIAYRSRSLVLV